MTGALGSTSTVKPAEFALVRPAASVSAAVRVYARSAKAAVVVMSNRH